MAVPTPAPEKARRAANETPPPDAQRHKVQRLVASRPAHANPVVEHMFRRFEDGATLREIAADMCGSGPTSAEAENWDFTSRLVLMTVAPGSEFQDQMQRLPEDLGDALQGKATLSVLAD